MGHTTASIRLLHEVLADSEQLYGKDHPNTLTARTNLAASYQQAGRTAEDNPL